jgi:single-stranded-DNA-specific exonuclease
MVYNKSVAKEWKDMRVWKLKRNRADTKKMSEVLGISEISACVLANRGIGTLHDAQKFLNCPIDEMYDGYLFKDMRKGINLIARAISKKKKIAVYGDYDVDGVMSTVILYKTLKYFDSDVLYYLPHRQKEGYGMNEKAVVELKKKGVDVILACDNGISALNEIKKANELGIVSVILDHHEVPYTEDSKNNRKDSPPEAFAVIDAKQSVCPYPFKNLCAAGMAYKFSKLLFEKMNMDFVLDDEFLSLAAIATVCDIVDLKDENRIIVKNGLEKAANTSNPGLKALIIQTGISGRKLNEYHAGFVLGPCINATGRLESAQLAVKLFAETDSKNADLTASELVRLNAERKDMTAKAVEIAKKKIAEDGLEKDKVLVIYDKDIHESIAGIVAGRIKDTYYRPVIILTDGETQAKGSARSIEGYNIFEELFKCRELFERFGGHPMAAGLTLKKENIPILRKRLNESCNLTESDMAEVIRIDAQLGFDDISIKTAHELERFAPFGRMNPKPLFGSKNVAVSALRVIGKNKNILKFTFIDKKTSKIIDGISFDGYDEYCEKVTHKYGADILEKILNRQLSAPDMDIVYSLGINRFNSRETVQLEIKDFRFREDF